MNEQPEDRTTLLTKLKSAFCRFVFWLPLFFTLAVTEPTMVRPPGPHAMIWLLIFSLGSISVYTIQRTLQEYASTKKRTGVIFTSIKNSILAGIFCGAMISIPSLVLYLMSIPLGLFPFSHRPGDQLRIVTSVVMLPCTGLIGGIPLGIVLGFICDARVSLARHLNKTAEEPESPI